MARAVDESACDSNCLAIPAPLGAASSAKADGGGGGEEAGRFPSRRKTRRPVCVPHLEFAAYLPVPPISTRLSIYSGYTGRASACVSGHANWNSGDRALAFPRSPAREKPQSPR